MAYYPKKPTNYNFGKDYDEKFNPQMYMKAFTTDHPFRAFPIRKLHEFYSTLKTEYSGQQLNILDYGCGPLPTYQISASAVASEIVMADYMEKNRQALQQWLSKDPSAHDWSPVFDFVVQGLEGKSEQDAREREKRLRDVVKAVVPCDITEDLPIADEYKGPYDVVLSSLCIEAAAKTVEEYNSGVRKLVSLIKPGGKMILCCVDYSCPGEQRGFYHVGAEVFISFCCSQDIVTTALTKAGLRDIEVNSITRESLGMPPSVDKADALVGFLFITATK